MCQELSFQAVLRESRGESELPEGFGEGETCTCGESRIHGFQMSCSNCVLPKEALGLEQPRGPGSPSEEAQNPEAPNPEACMYSQDQKQHAEAIAQELETQRRYGIEDAQPLLQQMAQMWASKVRNMASADTLRRASYYLFGLYSHGGQYGITNRTHDMPCVTR